MANIKIKFNIKPLEKFRKDFSRQMKSNSLHTTLGSMWKLIGIVYLTFTRKRFSNYSRGGGNWPPLSPLTLARRRKGKRGNKASILYDTGILFGALSIGTRGNFFKKIPYGVQVGFSKTTKHKGNSTTIRDIAIIHDLGKGKMPKREILVEPDGSTTKRMHNIIRKKMQQFGKECENVS